VIFRETTDCEGLPSTGLTVGKDRPVVALHDIFYNGVGDLGEDVILTRVPIVDLIESELLGDIICGTLD
jgi:hypothetical protein